MRVVGLIQQLQLAIQASRTQLKRLGKLLFYAYLVLMVVCVLSFLLGVLAVFQKMIYLNALFNTSWVEAFALMIISAFAFRIFFHEVLRLVDLDQKQEVESVDSNIIPFPKKSTW